MRKLFLSLLMFYTTSAFSDEYLIAGVGGVRESIKAPSFGTSASSSDIAFEISAGHKYNKNLAVEAEYIDYGSIDFAGGPASGYSVGIFALASTPLCSNCFGNDWSLFGKIGVADTFFKLKPATGYALSVPASQSKIAPAYGLGIQVTNGDSKPKILKISYDRHTGGDNMMSETFSTIMVSAGAAF
jgi:hypothetical protein